MSEASSYGDNVKHEVKMEIVAPTLEEIYLKAKLEAATALAVSPEHVYIVREDTARVVAKARFEEEFRPTLWQSTITCGVIPEEFR